MTVFRRFGVSGAVLTILSVLLLCLFVFHRHLPNRAWNLGSLVETFLPWFGLAIIPLLVWAALKRNVVTIVVAILPGLVWAYMYGPLLPDKSEGPGDFRVLSHNVEDINPNPEETARHVRDANADVVALVEITSEAMPTYRDVLAEQYPYTADYGTVALWSKYPISVSEPVDIGIDWTRAFRATVQVEGIDVSIYVAHLLSVRLMPDEGFTIDQRNRTAQMLGDAIEADAYDRVILMGDLNGTMQDKTLAPITYQMRSAHASAGRGFGFTWPSSFPVARIDQILYRGLEATDAQVLSQTGSDHLPVQADFNL
nr:endonuclease/exonuclease/phosphatase family protein [Natronoglycomyces albus]